MTHPDAINAAGERPAPSERPVRWVLPMVIVTIVLLAVVGFMIYRNEAADSVRAELAAWDTPDGDVLPVTVEITRDAGVAVTCNLIAVDERQVIVGELTLDVPAGPETRLRVPAEIPLEGDGIAPELRGCATSD